MGQDNSIGSLLGQIGLLSQKNAALEEELAELRQEKNEIEPSFSSQKFFQNLIEAKDENLATQQTVFENAVSEISKEAMKNKLKLVEFIFKHFELSEEQTIELTKIF